MQDKPTPATPSAAYLAKAEEWRLLADSLDGEPAIKAAKTRYLPKLGGQDEDDYAGYLARAHYYEATSRTLQGLEGAATRKPPTVTLPGSLDPIRAVASPAGLSLEALGREVTRYALAYGRCLLLAEYDGGRPWLCLYGPLSVIAWREEWRDGRLSLSQVRIREESAEPDGEWGERVVPRVRVLDLEGGIYRVRVFEEIETVGPDGARRKEWALVSEVVPRTLGGSPLEEIPAVFVGAVGHSPTPEVPPLAALARANIRHYVVDAEISHGLHFCALPTPWVVGGDLQHRTAPNGGPAPALKIGSSQAWDLPMGASCGILEWSGAGIGSYQQQQDKIRDEMVSLGAQALAGQKREAESAEALRLRQGGETSLLSLVAETVSEGLTRALRWCADYVRAPRESVEYRMSRDFLLARLSPGELAALVSAWQSGAIDALALAHALEAGEVLPPGRTAAEHAALIEGGDDPLPSTPPAPPAVEDAPDRAQEID